MKHYFVVAAILLSAVSSANAQNAQEFWVQEFAKTNKKPVNAVRYVARQLTPRQIRRNTEAVLRAPYNLGKMVFDGVDRAGRLLIEAKGKNLTEFTCLQCGREQRRVHIQAGFRDCKYGDVTHGWKHPSCSTPAPAGAINSLRITGPHIEKVVGMCPHNPQAPIAVADGNGPGGVNSVRCVPVWGATYHYPILASGDPKVDGPFYMQPDPCRGRGRNPRHLT